MPTNNEENENITLTAQKTTVNEDMLITDNATSPLTIAPPAKVSSSENADGLSDPESDEPETNSLKDHQFDSLGDEDVKPNDSSKKNQLSGRFLNVEELFDVLQSGPASSSSIPQGVKENTYFLVENHENIEKRRQGKKSNFEDDCGAWSSKSSSTKKNLFHYAGESIKMVQLKNAQYCTKRLGEWVPLEPQPLEDEVMVMKRFYACLKRKPEYKKRVTWIEKVAKQMDFLVQEMLWLNTLASFPKL